MDEENERVVRRLFSTACQISNLDQDQSNYGMSNCNHLFDFGNCLGASYFHKHKLKNEEIESGKGRRVLFVDMGHSSTTCVLVQFGITKERKQIIEKQQQEDNDEDEEEPVEEEEQEKEEIEVTSDKPVDEEEEEDELTNGQREESTEEENKEEEQNGHKMEEEEGEEEEFEMVSYFDESDFKILFQVSNPTLGAFSFDISLFRKFSEDMEIKYKVSSSSIDPSSKKGLRLMEGCKQARELLSTLPSTNIQVENLLDGADASFGISREEFEGMNESLGAQVASLLSEALDPLRTKMNIEEEEEHVEQQNHDDFEVEILGGGTRIPMIQRVIKEVVRDMRGEEENSDDVVLGMKMDDSSLAFGASLLYNKQVLEQSNTVSSKESEDGGEGGDQKKEEEEDDDDCCEDVGMIQDLIAFERQMREWDDEERIKGELKNELESFVFEMRQVASGGGKYAKHCSLVDQEKLSTTLNEIEDWMWSDEAYGIRIQQGVDEIRISNGEYIDLWRGKLTEYKESVTSLCSDYLEKVEEEKREVERKMEEESKKREEEEGNGNEEDDDRKLPTSVRLRLVKKNKEEGNELFKGKNFKPAAARYAKALGFIEFFLTISLFFSCIFVYSLLSTFF